MTRRLRRFLALSGSERALFIRAYVDLCLIDVALRIFGFRRIVGWIPAPGDDRVISLEDLRRAGRYARWIEVASRHHIVPARCLQQSLVLHQWLRREDLPSKLRIGVRKEDGALKAHAWVELGAQIVNDRSAVLAAFTPLVSLGALGRAWRPSATNAILGRPDGLDEKEER